MAQHSFSELHLAEHFLHQLDHLGFNAMTPIQVQALPAILEGKDVIAQGKTGSGKTLAFSLGLLQQINSKQFDVQALVLCPTRELAEQVAKEIRTLARALSNVKVLSLCGGSPFKPQMHSLRHGAHVVVGTPGRVLDHLQRGSLSLDALNTLVLDEADRMLDMGFIESIEAVVGFTPATRQSLLFSATYPETIVSLSENIQNTPVFIQAEQHEVKNPINEAFYRVNDEDKTVVLAKLLARHRPNRTIVFTNRKQRADEVAEALQAMQIDALAIHGDLEQIERTDVFVQFSNFSCSVLVATDVAARGLDVQGLELVVNYDLPLDSAVYTHRIGRTGRAGETGLAISLYAHDDELANYHNDAIALHDAGELDEAIIALLPDYQTLVIEAGKKQKMRPGDILGALTGEGGLNGDVIGKIDIYPTQSYVAIQRASAQKAFDALKHGKIKGRRFSVWIL
jgi:ATP-dependent RNA helicase DbpA